MSASARASVWRDLIRKPFFWGIVAIVALLALNVLKDPTYLAISINPNNGNSSGNLVDILRQAAPIMMIAIGMSLVIATGGIDLSVGSLMAVAGAVSMEFPRRGGDSGSVGVALAAVGLALLVTAILGAVNGILVAYVGLQPFIATLVLMLAGRGIAKVITGGQNTAASSDPFRWIANGFDIGIPVVFILAVAIVLVVAWVVRPQRPRSHDRGDRHQPEGEPDGRNQAEGSAADDLRAQRHPRGIAGVMSVGSVMTVDISRTVTSSSWTRSSPSSSAAPRSPVASSRSAAPSSVLS